MNAKSTLAFELKDKVDSHLDLWKLQFTPPYSTKNGRRQWNVADNLRNHPGIIVLKSADTIVSLHYSQGGMNQQLLDLVSRRKKMLNVDSVAIVPVEKKHLMDAYTLYKIQRAYLSQENIATRILPVLRDPYAVPADVLARLDFKSPFIGSHRDEKRRYTFASHHYSYISGVYVLLLDGKIVHYVGKATSWYNRFYSHFSERSGVVKYRPNKEMGKFNYLFNEYSKVEVACIDVPMLTRHENGDYEMRNHIDIQNDLIDLERELTILLKPAHVDVSSDSLFDDTFVHSPPDDTPAPF